MKMMREDQKAQLKQKDVDRKEKPLGRKLEHEERQKDRDARIQDLAAIIGKFSDVAKK